MGQGNNENRMKTGAARNTTPSTSEALVICGLRLSIGQAHIVRDVALQIQPGECLALVGESGCGKSMTALSLMGLAPEAAHVSWERYALAGQLITEPEQLGAHCGRDVAMVFQNPMTAMNPTMPVGRQIEEVLRRNKAAGSPNPKLGLRSIPQQAQDWMERVGIAQAAERAGDYPHQFSGGQLQRLVIAMAAAAQPKLLIADEPTTALDVTVQSEILALLSRLQRDMGMAVLLITHDLGVVARQADRVAVMYAGEIVEQGSVEQVFYQGLHPYTRALAAAVPDLRKPLAEDGSALRLQGIPGRAPDLRWQPKACRFAPRCDKAMQLCSEAEPPMLAVQPQLKASLVGEGDTAQETPMQSRCWLAHPECAAAVQLAAAGVEK